MINIEISPEENGNPISVKLKARRMLDGTILVSDHPDMDIVVDIDKMKIVCFPKNSMDDEIYNLQDKFFAFLFKRGIVSQDTIKSGNVYYALQGDILPPKDHVSTDEIVLLNIAKFIEDERPTFVYQKAIEQEEEDRLLEPDSEDSTELGEVPHKEKKGTLPDKLTKRYWLGM